MAIDQPRLRHDILPVTTEHEGQQLLVMQDPRNCANGSLAVPPAMVWLLQFFDGAHTRAEMQEEFKKASGQDLAIKQLDEIIDRLDSVFLLESDTFAARLEEMTEEFRETPTRPPAHAGQSYPAEAGMLRDVLSGYYVHEKGPGAFVVRGEDKDGDPVKAIIAPHIDLRSGGPCFAHGYHALSQAPRPDLVIILGTGHAGALQHFAATRKDFETPLGLVKTDAEFVEDLGRRFAEASEGADLFADELLHRNEHVIEFQTLFLRHLFGESTPKIAPILCSYSYINLDKSAAPESAKRIDAFITSLREAITDYDGNVCIVASVDFAHLGPRYGDPERVPTDQLEACGVADQKLLERLAEWDREGFVDLIRKEEDARRVCGFPCLNTMLSAIEPAKGRILARDIAAADDAGSFVSFAGMAFS